jgi:hypothetical protein
MKTRRSDDPRDQFRTLDDPPERAAEAAPPAGPYPIPKRMDDPRWQLPVGYWRVDLRKRPGPWRRFWAWVLLGYRWHHYSD